MAKEPAKTGPTTGTIGEVAPAAERVALGTDTSALALAAAAAAATGGVGPAVTGTAQAATLDEAARLLDAPEILREVPGPGVGAERVAERVTGVQDRPLGEAARTAPVMPAATPIDPDDVPGRRRVEVATRITHGDLDYAPDHRDPGRRSLLLTFKQYAELASIGAVIPLSSRAVRDWADDED